MEKEKYRLWVFGIRSHFFFFIFLIPGLALSILTPIYLGIRGFGMPLFIMVSLGLLLWRLPRLFAYRLELILHNDQLHILPLKQAALSPKIESKEVSISSIKAFTAYGYGGGRSTFHKMLLKYESEELKLTTNNLLSVSSILQAKQFSKSLKTQLRSNNSEARLAGEEVYWRSTSMKWQLAISFAMLLSFTLFSIYQVTIASNSHLKGGIWLLVFNAFLLLGWYGYFWRKYRKYQA